MPAVLVRREMVEIPLTIVGLLGGFLLAEVAAWLQRRRDLANQVLLKSSQVTETIRRGNENDARWYLGELRPYVGLVELLIPRAAEEVRDLVAALDSAIRSRSFAAVDTARTDFVRAARLV